MTGFSKGSCRRELVVADPGIGQVSLTEKGDLADNPPRPESNARPKFDVLGGVAREVERIGKRQ